MLSQFIQPMETVAVTCGMLNVALAARTSNWNWLFGIISTTIYTIIFLHVKLYADMALQIFFLSMQFYGLYRWRIRTNHQHMRVSRAPKWAYIILIFGGLSGYWILHYILSHYTDSTTTHLDAITTAYSLLGQWMMSEKWIENWYVWIFVDLLSLQMYFSKQLYLTIGLYSTLLVFCVFGYRFWSSQMNITRSSTMQHNTHHLPTLY